MNSSCSSSEQLLLKFKRNWQWFQIAWWKTNWIFLNCKCYVPSVGPRHFRPSPSDSIYLWPHHWEEHQNSSPTEYSRFLKGWKPQWFGLSPSSPSPLFWCWWFWMYTPWKLVFSIQCWGRNWSVLVGWFSHSENNISLSLYCWHHPIEFPALPLPFLYSMVPASGEGCLVFQS